MNVTGTSRPHNSANIRGSTMQRTGKRSSLGVLDVPVALSPTLPPALRSLKDTACSLDTRQLLTAAACPLLNPASRVSHAWETRSSEFPVDRRAALAMVAAMWSTERERGIKGE